MIEEVNQYRELENCYHRVIFHTRNTPCGTEGFVLLCQLANKTNHENERTQEKDEADSTHRSFD